VSVVYGRPLSELDQVDWASLSHAYGSAEDVLDQLRAVAAGDEEAFSDLYGNLWHQGTVYQATAHAVPFLIGLLEVGDAEILHPLACMAQGYSYHDVHQMYDDPAQRAEPAYQAVIARELRWVEAVRAAVVGGVPVYRRFLSDPNPEYRELAANLLALLAAEVPDAREWLIVGLSDGESAVRAVCAQALARFSASPDAVEAVRQQGLNDPEFLPRLMAAFTLAHWQQTLAPAWAGDLLEEALARLDVEELLSPLLEGPSLLRQLAYAAGELDQSERFARLLWSHFQENSQDYSDEDYFDEALALAYPAPGAPLTPLLITLLNDLLGRHTPLNSWYQQYLHQLGLPTAHESMSAWLQERES
jgi:HEAT repeats